MPHYYFDKVQRWQVPIVEYFSTKEQRGRPFLITICVSIDVKYEECFSFSLHKFIDDCSSIIRTIHLILTHWLLLHLRVLLLPLSMRPFYLSRQLGDTYDLNFPLGQVKFVTWRNEKDLFWLELATWWIFSLFREARKWKAVLSWPYSYCSLLMLTISIFVTW